MYPDQNVAGGFGVASSPAYANGCIYFGADKPYCVWATNGTVRWKVNKPNVKHGDGTPTLANGRVYITGSDYKLYSIDQLTGQVYWTFQAKSDYPPAIPDNWGLYAAPAIDNGRVFLAACDWYLYSINETQPTSVATANHSFQMGWASYSSPVIVGDKVYVGCSYNELRTESRFYCFWASNLTKIWEFYPGVATGFFSSAGYYNGLIYVGAIDGNLYCLNATTGAETWKYDVGGTWSSPAMTTERLYIGSKTGYIYCFNLSQPGTPEYYWRYQITGEVDASPSVVPGRVYIGTHGGGGRIYCFGTPDAVPPQVTSTFPVNGATDVPSTTDIKVTFNEEINSNTLTVSSFKVVDSSSNPVLGSISYETSTNTATFNPATSLKKSEIYTATITTLVQDLWMNSLDGNKNNVQDGSPTDDHSWSFTTSSNQPPSLSTQSIIPTAGDLATEFEFSIVYTDLDNDTPELTPAYIRILIDNDIVGQDMSLNLSAPITLRDGNFTNGEEYIYKTTFTTWGLHKYKFICYDGLDSNETETFFNPMLADDPEIDPIAELTAYEDVDLVLDLSDKIHDGDTNISNLTITVNSTYATIVDLNITFNYPNEFNYPSGRDYEYVAINVSDSVFNASRDVKINVFAVNDPPVINGVPNIQIQEDENQTINITPNLSDIDNELDELTIFSYSSFSTVNGKEITFYYPVNSGIVSELVKIEVYDGEDYGHQNITVSIIPEGSDFVLLPVLEQNAIEDVELVIEMEDYIAPYSDIPMTDFEIEINSTYGSVTGTNLTFYYPNEFNYPSGRDHEIVRVNVTYADQTETQEFKINVLAINDGPALDPVEVSKLVLEGTSLKFQTVYSDVDGSETPVVKVVVGKVEHDLTYISGDIHGVGGTYLADLTIPVGEYKYHYLGNDNENEINSVFQSQNYTLKVIEYSETGDDSDGDTIPDGWELKFGLDPFDTSDADNDDDSDTYTNLEEYLGPDGLPGGNDSSDPTDDSDIPVGDPIPPDDKKSQDDDEVDFLFIGIILMIIIVVIIILAIIMLTKRRREPEYTQPYVSPEEPPVTEEPPADGSEIPPMAQPVIRDDSEMEE
jgi:outer membrane protein assembly factor BamB